MIADTPKMTKPSASCSTVLIEESGETSAMQELDDVGQEVDSIATAHDMNRCGDKERGSTKHQHGKRKEKSGDRHC